MKHTARRTRETDDSLFGLLSAYKPSNTYFRILTNPDKKRVLFQMTDNPRHFTDLSDDALSGYTMLRRTDIGAVKLSAKYISPKNIIEHYGENLGIKISSKTGKIQNRLQDKEPLYQLETTLAQNQALITIVKKILLLTPQKKYEIIEKYLSSSMTSEIEV